MGEGCRYRISTIGIQPSAAAVGDETRFDFGVGRAEDNGVISEVGIDVAQRWQERGEEFVARAVGLVRGQFTPKIGARSHGLIEGGEPHG